MNPRFASVVFLFSVLSPALPSAEPTAPQFPPHHIVDTQLRVLPRSASGREYQLHVSLPPDYSKESSKRYPVLFVTDGYWDFETVHSGRNNLIYDRVVPSFIIVGLGYAGKNIEYNEMRNWELTPVKHGAGTKSGHAAEFLTTIEKEIIPFVEREYRVDSSYRVLAGSSLGGLFTLYTMYTKPELFQGYIAASPAVAVGDDWLFGYEEAFAKSGKPIKARLYLTGAENEWPSFLGAIKRFDEQIKTRAYPGFSYQFRLVDGERHAGTKGESYTRGMRYVFEPLAPEKGKSSDRH